MWGAKSAILDFRATHGIEDEQHPMRDVDGWCAWFQKQRDVPIKRHLYLRATEQRNQTGLRPTPLLTNEDYYRLMKNYDAAKRPPGAPKPLLRNREIQYWANVERGGT